MIKRPRIQAGVPGRHRGVLVLEGSVNVHVLVNLEGYLVCLR